MARSSVFLPQAFFHRSWSLRRSPSCLLECSARQLTPQLSFLSSSPPILLCVVSLDTGWGGARVRTVSLSSQLPPGSLPKRRWLSPTRRKLEAAVASATASGSLLYRRPPSLIFLSVEFTSYLPSGNFSSSELMSKYLEIAALKYQKHFLK